MNVEIKEQMYEGKAKQVFATSDPEIVMVHYKDDATAGDGEKKGTIRDKGIVNNKLSNALMQKLEKEGIPTHYVEELNDRDTLVKKRSDRSSGSHHPQCCRRPLQPAHGRARGQGVQDPHPGVQLQERRPA